METITIILCFYYIQAAYGLTEEIPLFDWSSLTEDLQSVPCSSNGHAWACGGASSRHYCQCDADCARYGDCCLDKARASLERRSTALDQSWRCSEDQAGFIYLTSSTLFAHELENMLFKWAYLLGSKYEKFVGFSTFFERQDSLLGFLSGLELWKIL